MKQALVALVSTVTDADTVTDILLLVRLTVRTLSGAAAFSVTVHAYVPYLL